MFDSIYYWFSGLFGQPLYKFLRGIDCAEAQTLPDYLPTIGLVTLGVSFVVAVLFYFVINHPYFSKWWSWLLMMSFSGVLSLAAGFFFVNSKDNQIPVYHRYASTVQNSAELTVEMQASIEVSSDDDAEMNVETSGQLEISTDCGDLEAVPGTEQIFKSTYLQFGVANMIVSCLFFIVASLLFNWFSTNCKHSPFKF